MAIYHLSWDLAWFGYVSWPVGTGPGWRVFAGCIAGSFLFLTGVSLALAHAGGIRWRPFWRREAVIVAAAAAVSVATYFAFGDTFVRFGILHSIAAGSLLALAFTRLPAIAGLIAAALVGTAPLWAASPVFDGQLWLWTGLGTPMFGSVDYVPLAPWAALPLLGVALARIGMTTGLLAKQAQWPLAGRTGRALRFLGRHSLIIYLLHQPALYGLVWSADALGFGSNRIAVAYQTNCAASCQASQDSGVDCVRVCACTLAGLQEDGFWEPLTRSPQDPDLRAELNSHYAQCLADPAIFGADPASR